MLIVPPHMIPTVWLGKQLLLFQTSFLHSTSLISYPVHRTVAIAILMDEFTKKVPRIVVAPTNVHIYFQCALYPTTNKKLTNRRMSQLKTRHLSIDVIPAIITHSTPFVIRAHFQSTFSRHRTAHQSQLSIPT